MLGERNRVMSGGGGEYNNFRGKEWDNVRGKGMD